MDIVERLRRYRPTYGWPEERSVIVEPTMNHVAADEIERLRGLLKNWVDCCFVNFATDTIEIVDVGKVYVETRAALKGKK